MKYKKAVKINKWSSYVTFVVFGLIAFIRCGYQSATIVIIASILVDSSVVILIVM